MNVWLVRASQFLQQFCLVVQHKPGKKYNISDALNRLASVNIAGHDPNYSELDALFVYHTTLVKINSDLVKCILNGYAADNWWAKVHKQVLNNKELDIDKALFLFVLINTQPLNSDPYFQLKPKISDNTLYKSRSLLSFKI